MKSPKHANIALFIPHNGCKHQCSFCNQKSITGAVAQPGPKDVERAVKTAVSSRMGGAKSCELAFFGGSFTAVEEGYMLSLLEAAYPFVREGVIDGIRVSTRPDAVDEHKLSLLKKYGVTAVELGAQSMDDEVLVKNRRGHTASEVASASALIRERGFSLGLQMMTGLYGSDGQKDFDTAKKLAALSPDTMRVYPTVVLKYTALAMLYEAGEYHPMGLWESVALCARLLDFFEKQGIPVIKLGLQESETMKSDAIAGAVHPAFRELCEGERYLKRIAGEIKRQGLSPCSLKIRVHPREISKAVGQKRRNVIKLNDMGYRVQFVGDEALAGMQIEVEKCG